MTFKKGDVVIYSYSVFTYKVTLKSIDAYRSRENGYIMWRVEEPGHGIMPEKHMRKLTKLELALQ